MTGTINVDENITGTLKVDGTISGVIQIGGGSQPVLEGVTVKSTAQSQTVLPSEGVDGFDSVTVSPIALQSKSVTPGSSAQTVTPDSGYDGLSSVTVGAASGGDCVLDFSVSWQGVIEQSMFMGMTDITSVIFKVNHSNLEIKKWGFKNCTNLKRVEIPVCTKIGPNAFNGVTGHDVYIGASTAFGFDPIPMDQAYDIGEPRSIHCPPELVSVYKANEVWGVWKDIIVGDYNWPY
jgi:hypothetical protein